MKFFSIAVKQTLAKPCPWSVWETSFGNLKREISQTKFSLQETVKSLMKLWGYLTMKKKIKTVSNHKKLYPYKITLTYGSDLDRPFLQIVWKMLQL